MPQAAFCILLAMLEYGEEASACEMSVSSGYDTEKYSRLINKMVLLGWLSRPWCGRWMLTERGKIVAAIESARRTRRVKLGRPAHTVTLRQFLAMEAC